MNCDVLKCDMHVHSTFSGDSTTGVDFGLAFGAGADFPGFMKGLFVDLRYELGFKDVFKDATSRNAFKNRGFVIGAGVRI